MNTYGVIMAGGGGTRFWPLSRQAKPKQLLNLSGQGLMINETISRIKDVIEPKNIFIVTNKNQIDQMTSMVNPDILREHILAEPQARNTAACIGYAAFEILLKYGDGVMCIFPSDHYIKDIKEFQRVLQAGIIRAEQSPKLITIGIKPTFPSTGYGYIKYDQESIKDPKQAVYDVMEFVEKPNYKLARQYIESGQYVWNSGVFLWKASVIIENFKRFLPKVYEYLYEISKSIGSADENETLSRIYPMIPSISIDYGIMERSNDVEMLIGDFGWNDVGSWDTLGELYDMDESGNVIKGEQINLNTKNCISYSQSRFIATVGVENLIIVETQDAVLVCKKDQAQDVKLVVDQIKSHGELKYLL